MDPDPAAMTELNLRTDFEYDLRNLFKNALGISYILNRGFAISEKIEKDSILFIGLNPSFIEEQEPHLPDAIFYNLSQKGNYKYFKKFEEISSVSGIRWSHLDLLSLRETNQKCVTELFENPEGLDFIWKHLLITKQILERCEPKIIVVANTAARRLLGKDVDTNSNNKWLGYQFHFDEAIGTYRFSSMDSNLMGTPVFFSSMLTGQRALDKGSYERLKWQIQWVLKNDHYAQKGDKE
jgi:hypothetical protein